MYDTFSTDYDRFVNWPSRLAVELPFILNCLESLQQTNKTQLHLLDSACGTGMHAISLALRGWQTTGADLSQPMIERARLNAVQAGVGIRFEAVCFGSLASTFGAGSFDAVLCLGNSLPHVNNTIELARTLVDFAECLRPGGLLILQNRNFDSVLASHNRWMEPQAHRENDNEWIFLRFYDFDPDGLISFHIITLQRQRNESWTQDVRSTRLLPLLYEELLSNLKTTGFSEILAYGNLAGDPFDKISSPNLVVTAHKIK